MSSDPATLAGAQLSKAIRLPIEAEAGVGLSGRFGKKGSFRSVRGGHQSEQRERWSPRATLALSGGVSLLLWGAIGLAIFGSR